MTAAGGVANVKREAITREQEQLKSSWSIRACSRRVKRTVLGQPLERHSCGSSATARRRYAAFETLSGAGPSVEDERVDEQVEIQAIRRLHRAPAERNARQRRAKISPSARCGLPPSAGAFGEGWQEVESAPPEDCGSGFAHFRHPAQRFPCCSPFETRFRTPAISPAERHDSCAAARGVLDGTGLRAAAVAAEALDYLALDQKWNQVSPHCRARPAQNARSSPARQPSRSCREFRARACSTWEAVRAFYRRSRSRCRARRVTLLDSATRRRRSLARPTASSPG